MQELYKSAPDATGDRLDVDQYSDNLWLFSVVTRDGRTLSVELKFTDLVRLERTIHIEIDAATSQRR